MRKTILLTMAWLGIYETIRQAWNYFEKLELGFVAVTKTDSVICGLISLIVLIILAAEWNFD